MNQYIAEFSDHLKIEKRQSPNTVSAYRRDIKRFASYFSDKKISAVKDIVPLLEKVTAEGRALFIIAEDVDGEAQAALILNIIRGSLKVCAVKAPGFGDDQKDMLEDIALLTGGKL